MRLKAGMKRKRQVDAAVSGSSIILALSLLVTSSTISSVHSLLSLLCLDRSYNNRRAILLSTSSSTMFGNALVCPSSSSTTSSSHQSSSKGISNNNYYSYLTMRVSGTNSRNRDSKSSILVETNNNRLRIAGNPGSSNFIDPTKLFIGNLPFTANEDDITSALAKHWNTNSDSDNISDNGGVVDERIQSIKIVRDWKTGLSKGYGFIQFYDPMAATSAIVDINSSSSSSSSSKIGGGLIVGGRKVRLDQGKRKPNENDPKELKRKMKEERKKKRLAVNELDEEGRVIYIALSGSTDNIDDDLMDNIESEMQVKTTQDKGKGMSEDDMIAFMERGGLRGAMALTEETAGYLVTKGLYVDDDTTSNNDDDDDKDENSNTLDYEKYYNENGYRDTDYSDDIDDINDDDDDDGTELVYDGVFEEVYNPNEYESLTDEEAEEYAKMNREQRRAAEKKRKKRKLPFRGFGKDTPNGSISMD